MLLSYIHRGHKFIQAIKVIVVRPACVCLKYFKEMTQQCLNQFRYNIDFVYSWSLIEATNLFRHFKCAWSNSIPTIMGIILWDFLMLYQFFLSPQPKRNAIISQKQGIYELSQELQNELRLRILKDQEKSEKSQNLLEL